MTTFLNGSIYGILTGRKPQGRIDSLFIYTVCIGWMDYLVPTWRVMRDIVKTIHSPAFIIEENNVDIYSSNRYFPANGIIVL